MFLSGIHVFGLGKPPKPCKTRSRAIGAASASAIICPLLTIANFRRGVRRPFTIPCHPSPVRNECKLESYTFDVLCHESCNCRMPDTLAHQKTIQDSAQAHGYRSQGKTLPHQGLATSDTRGSLGRPPLQTGKKRSTRCRSPKSTW